MKVYVLIGCLISTGLAAQERTDEPPIVQPETKEEVKESAKEMSKALQETAKDTGNAVEYYTAGFFERLWSYDATRLENDFAQARQNLRMALEEESKKDQPDFSRIRASLRNVVSVLDEANRLERDGEILEWHENAAVAVIGVGTVGFISNTAGWMVRGRLYSQLRGMPVEDIVPGSGRAVAVEKTIDSAEDARIVVQGRKKIRRLPLHRHKFWAVTSLLTAGAGIAYERYVDYEQERLAHLIATSLDRRIEIYRDLIRLEKGLQEKNQGSVFQEFPELSIANITERLEKSRSLLLIDENN